MDELRVRKAFKRTLKEAKVRAFRLYDVRHTYASLILAERAPITYVAEQLGHANPSTTLRYYRFSADSPRVLIHSLLGSAPTALSSSRCSWFDRAGLQPGCSPWQKVSCSRSSWGCG